MEGIYIGRARGGGLSSLSALVALGSFAAAIVIGPRWIAWLSMPGFCLALAAFIQARRSRALEKPVVFPSLLMGIHAVFLVMALVLHSMFLAPLPEHARKIPKLQNPYADSGGLFTFKGPMGWKIRPVPSTLETGVRLQPEEQSAYMGVSEVTLFVRRLETAPASSEEFLKRAASAFSEGRGKKQLFDLRTEKGTSLGGEPVMWSELTVKRFWVPLFQVSVFGVKNKRYLCSVSATGLKSHSDLSKLLCLGLFERILITDKPSR